MSELIALNDIKFVLRDIKFGFGVMHEFPDSQGSAVVVKPEEMSITADASKGQCQFNLHPLAPPSSVDAQGIFLYCSVHHVSSLNIRRRLFQILLVQHFS